MTGSGSKKNDVNLKIKPKAKHSNAELDVKRIEVRNAAISFSLIII